MGLNLDEKKALVAEVGATVATAQAMVLAEYRSLEVGEITKLRAKARGAGVYLRVLKNTLARRAVAETPFAGHPTIGTAFALAHTGVLKPGSTRTTFGLGVGPINLDLEGKVVELRGSGEQQFIEWRRLLKELYQNETGLDAPVAGNAPVKP